MSTYMKVFAAAAAVMLAAAGVRAEGDPLLTTSIGQATQSSLGNYAHRNRCAVVFEASDGSAYEGNCFGFPGEVMSAFGFDRFGRLIRSRIMLGDAGYALSRIRSLTAVRGTPREVIRAEALSDRVLEWRNGDERWRFIECAGTGEWEFVRELIAPELLPQPDELPGLFPEPEPYYAEPAAFDSYRY